MVINRLIKLNVERVENDPTIQRDKPNHCYSSAA